MDKRDKRVVGAAIAAAIVIAIILLAAGWYITRDDSEQVAGTPASQTPVATGTAAGTSASQPPQSSTATETPATSGQQTAPQIAATPDATAEPAGGSNSALSGGGTTAQQPQAATGGGNAPQAPTQSATTELGTPPSAPAQSTPEQPGTAQTDQAGASPSASAPTAQVAEGTTGSGPQTGTATTTQPGMAVTGQATVQPRTDPATETAVADGAANPDAGTTILTEDQVATLPPIRPPSFDVVRVNELGDAVIAGRAEPRSIVIIYDGDREIGRVAADSRGEWVFVSDRPLTPGQHEIGLLARSGPQSRLSEQVVVLIAPEPREDIAGRPSEGDPDREKPLALLVPRDEIGATTVLQSPQATASATEQPPPRTGRPVAQDGAASSGPGSSDDGAPVSIDVVDYDEAGRLIVSGRSAPESDVRLYLDNEYVGTARTEADGSFEVQPADPVEPGVYALRVDEVNPTGSVTARAETPFQRADAVSAAPPGYSQVVVQPGNSLWRLARRVYGEGIQYTVIYQANNGQIRNPDLIYPGQVFNVPEMPTDVPGGDPS